MSEDAISETDVIAFLAADRMEKTRAYVERGRLFSRLDQEALEARWIQTFEATAADPSTENRALNNDLSSEFELRSLEPPYGKVKDAIDLFAAKAAAAMAEIQQSDPARHEEIQLDLLAEFEEYEAALKHPN
jgi:hypothetical protein